MVGSIGNICYQLKCIIKTLNSNISSTISKTSVYDHEIKIRESKAEESQEVFQVFWWRD